jgi:hypothetical protein
MTDNVQIENSNGILTLTLARPEKKNALTNEMYGKLADAIEAADNDATVLLILIRGQGDSFTAGNDIAEFAAWPQAPRRAKRHVIHFIRSLSRLTKLWLQPCREGPSAPAPLRSCIAILRCLRITRSCRRRSSVWRWCPTRPQAC